MKPGTLKTKILAGAVALFAWAGPVRAFNPEAVMVTPSSFDFGWCPDNAKVSADFAIRNTGIDLVAITAVQPTCGCTASQFTPGSLGANQETKVTLTFNTRGYAGSGFSKNSKVKTENGGPEYNVNLTGFVLDDKAPVIPDGDGIAAFEPGSSAKTKTVMIKNKGDKDVTLEMIQKPASWATAKMSVTSVKPGATVPVEISVDGPYDQEKTTSFTLAANDGAKINRLTVAIRTGPAPTPIRKPQAQPQPAPTQTGPSKK